MPVHKLSDGEKYELTGMLQATGKAGRSGEYNGVKWKSAKVDGEAVWKVQVGTQWQVCTSIPEVVTHVSGEAVVVTGPGEGGDRGMRDFVGSTVYTLDK